MVTAYHKTNNLKLKAQNYGIHQFYIFSFTFSAPSDQLPFGKTLDAGHNVGKVVARSAAGRADFRKGKI